MRNTFLMGILGMVLFCGAANAELIDNGDGTVSDTETGLMWQQGEPGAMTWNAALTYCENLVLPEGGYDDWRLPNRNELQSLVDYSKGNPPVIDTDAFPYAMSSYYWSSTTHATNADYACDAYFAGGYVMGHGKSNSYYVRAVRGGE